MLLSDLRHLIDRTYSFSLPFATQVKDSVQEERLAHSLRSAHREDSYWGIDFLQLLKSLSIGFEDLFALPIGRNSNERDWFFQFWNFNIFILYSRINLALY